MVTALKNSRVLLLAALISAAAFPAHAGWMVTADGHVNAPPRVIHAKPKPVVMEETPLLAAVPPRIEDGDTSSDTTSFVITTVDTDGHDTHATPLAEYVYHTQGNPATYHGEPYMNFRGYNNDSGYSNDSGGYNNYYGYNGGFSY